MRSGEALKNVVSNFALQIITIIYGFVVPKTIINVFESNVNGLVSSITQFLTYISLLESGFGPVVKSILYKPIANNSKEEIKNILKTSEKFFRKIAYIFIVYVVVLLAIYPIIVNNEFDYVFTASLIIIIAVSTFAEYYFGMTYRLFLQADQKNYVISIIQIISYIISLIFIVVLAKVGASIHVIKLISCIIFIFRPIIQNYYVKKRYSINLKDADDKYELKQKWDGLAQHIAAVVHGNTDVTVLTIFTNLVEVSVYSVYYLVINSVKLLLQSFINGVDASFGDMMAKNEQNNLREKFHLYEIIYYTICTIAFACTILLITPFVSVYTKNVTDANYIRNTFGILLSIGYYIWAIRLPYNAIVHAAGHFKETKRGAWVECFLNLTISIALVIKYGIIGVAVGTIVAMTVRTVEIVYYSNKCILKRNVFESIKKISIIIIETLIIIFICRYIHLFENVSYINWIKNALIVGVVSVIITCTINYCLYKKGFKDIVLLLKRANFHDKKMHN